MLVWVVLKHYFVVTGLVAVTPLVVVFMFMLVVTVRDFMVVAGVVLQVIGGLAREVSNIYFFVFESFLITSFLVASWLQSSDLAILMSYLVFHYLFQLVVCQVLQCNFYLL